MQRHPIWSKCSCQRLGKAIGGKLQRPNFAQGAVNEYPDHKTRMALAAKRILNSRLGALVARSGLTCMFGLLAAAIAVLATLVVS
jgi:hypothetical protein